MSEKRKYEALCRLYGKEKIDFLIHIAKRDKSRMKNVSDDYLYDKMLQLHSDDVSFNHVKNRLMEECSGWQNLIWY